jgi:hypothetical protein
MTGMHGSETLQNEVFGSQPKHYDLEFTRNLQKMLDQYSVDPVAREAISCSRIPSLLAESMRLAEGTAGKLAGLRAELIVTGGIGQYYSEPCTKLEEAHRGKVAAILSGEAANDASFEKAA